MTQLDIEKVWKIVKKTRISILSQHTDPDCNSDQTLLSESISHEIINILAAELDLKPTSTKKENVSVKILQNAGEIFTYLNFCPNKIQYFPKHLFKTGTPREMILSLTSIMKTSKNTAKKASTEIILLTLKSLGLYHYEEIQSITKGKCFNTNNAFQNCTKTDIIKNQETPQILGFPYVLKL